MILLIDNFDSFAYNLYQLVGLIDSNIKVVRNDRITLEEIQELAPKCIILSPGPKRPKDAGICLEVVRKLKGQYPMIGVCLGHQTICEAYGGEITYGKEIVHGKTSELIVEEESLIFKNCNTPIFVARYHSLVAREDTIPKDLRITARTKDGEVMALEDPNNKIYSMQFHPESFMTKEGKQMLINILGEVL